MLRTLLVILCAAALSALAIAQTNVANSSASLAGKTLITAEGAWTVTGLWSFSRSTSPPFAVNAGAAMVTNLDADKLHGQTDAFYRNATNLNAGFVPTGVLASGVADSTKFLRGDGTWATANPIGSCDLHLSLQSGNPYPTADVTGASATNVYVVPVKGGLCAFYDGSAVWTMLTNTQVTITVPSSSNTAYDVFCRNNGGTIACDTSTWTSDSARFGSGPYATLLPTQTSIYVRSTDGTTLDTTRRYIGSFRTTGTTGQTEDSALKRYVWSYYDRVKRPVRRLESTASWGWSTASWHQANAAAANQVELFMGVAGETAIDLFVTGTASNANPNVAYAVSIGEDSTTAPAAECVYAARKGDANNTAQIVPVTAKLTKQPAIGRHFYTWLEISTATAGTGWIGVDAVTFSQTGITGWIEG